MNITMPSVLSKRRLLILLVLLLLMAYPLFVLTYTWAHVAGAKFSGGRGGPLDAYRHTLASAVVTYTLDKRAVDFVSWLMERKGSHANQMDKHNNAIGAEIGLNAKSFSEIEPSVVNAVEHGTENAKTSGQITWLTQDRWHKSLFW